MQTVHHSSVVPGETITVTTEGPLDDLTVTGTNIPEDQLAFLLQSNVELIVVNQDQVKLRLSYDMDGQSLVAIPVEDRKMQLTPIQEAVQVAEWPSEHSDKAVREGWDIWDSEGSENGRWQVQRIDDPEAFAEATGFTPQSLASDDEAFRIVANGILPHHVAAREFLRAHNPREYQAVMRFADRKVVHNNGFPDRVRFNWGFHDGSGDAERAAVRDMDTNPDKMYGNGYVRGVLAWKNLGYRPESSDDAWNAFNQVSHQTERKLPKPSLMDDAQWIMNFLKSIEENGNHAPTETMQRLIDAIGELQVTPRIVIGLEGGIIQGATSNVPIEYLVYDYDIEGADGDEIAVRPALDGGEVEVFDSGVRIPEIDAVIVDTVFAAAEVSESLGKDTPSPGM